MQKERLHTDKNFTASTSFARVRLSLSLVRTCFSLCGLQPYKYSIFLLKLVLIMIV